MFATFILLVAYVIGISAFAPAPHLSHRSAAGMQLRMDSEDFSQRLGAQPPLGFWDPLGLLNDVAEERFDRLRYVEVKHGRIAMLAILGHLTTGAGFRLPGELAPGVAFADMKAGMAAFSTIPVGNLVGLFFFIGLLELGFGARQEDIEEAQLRACREKLDWDDATIERKMAIELNNGNFRMND